MCVSVAQQIKECREKNESPSSLVIDLCSSGDEEEQQQVEKNCKKEGEEIVEERKETTIKEANSVKIEIGSASEVSTDRPSSRDVKAAANLVHQPELRRIDRDEMEEMDEDEDEDGREVN